MTINDAYYEFSLLVNKNSERKDIQIDRLNYLVLFNREAPRWLAEFIERNRNTDNISTIKDFLVNNFKLVKNKIESTQVRYNYPADYFKLLHGNSYSNVSSGSCVGVIYNYFKKPNDWNVQIENKFIKPSIKWERGLGELYEDSIVIYKDNFEIQDTFISYYKKPVTLDLNNPDLDTDLQMSSYLVGQINDRIVSEVYRQFNSPAFNAAKTRETITI